MDTQTRRTAQTLLDFYAGFSSSSDEAQQRTAFGTAISSLNNSDALTVTQTDGGELTLDLTRLLLATGVSYQWLFARLSSATGESEETLTFELRTFFDGLVDD